MKRRLLFVTLLVGILAIGITGGTILAHGARTGGDSPLNSFASRVATILGIEETRVQDAFDQAAREMQDVALQQKLDRQVEQGHLTQEQADEHMKWFLSRPEGLSFGPGFRRHGFLGGGKWSGH